MILSHFPLVSIVIPTYIHVRYLPEAIESVLNQDYKNLELIVLDDGSTDGTSQVLESYGNRFYLESHRNKGQANTLNKGWRMAKGEVLADIAGIADGLISILSQPDLLKRLAISFQELVIEKYTWHSIVHNYVDLYRKILSGSSRT